MSMRNWWKKSFYFDFSWIKMGKNSKSKSYLKKSVDVLNDCDEQKLHDCHVCFVRLLPSAVVNALAIAYSCTQFCTLAYTRWQHGCNRVAVSSRVSITPKHGKHPLTTQFQWKLFFWSIEHAHWSSNTSHTKRFKWKFQWEICSAAEGNQKFNWPWVALDVCFFSLDSFAFKT